MSKVSFTDTSGETFTIKKDNELVTLVSSHQADLQFHKDDALSIIGLITTALEGK